ncbi:MAG: hypothetical protein K2W96_27405, partial [Gemmataceae bacterium]|nr:hypothetical protein [Gemmataceae bacterium]
MRIIGVLDIAGGVAVRGKGGRRAEYVPFKGCLSPGFDPYWIARHMRRKLGLRELYVADLDALTGRPPHPASFYESLRAEGLRLLIDHGMLLNEIAPAELARMKDAVKPVTEKYAAQLDPALVKAFYAELEKT